MKITTEIVRELLHYDPETGIFTWRERGEHWFKSDHDCRAWNSRYAGKRTGRVQTIQETGYRRRRITLLGLDRFEHRLAWMWMTDEPLPEEIDHKNRDGTDNRWLNLRESDRANNAKNISMKHNNTSGVTGVCWFKPIGKWQARCMANGKYHSLGYFDDLGEAAKVVMEFRTKHGFDPGHGAELACYRT